MGDVNLTVMFGVGMLLGSAHLCAGLAMGWYMGKSRPSPSGASVDLEPFVTAVDRLRLEMAELSQLTKAAPGPNQEIATLVARLALSLDELHQSMSSRPHQAAPSQPVEPDDKSHRMGAHAVSNRRILQWFANEEIRSPRSEEDARRYPFAVRQFAAMRRDEELPDPAAFEAVQCHDLSPTEVRYIVEQRPKGCEVVIGLGLPHPVKFLLARIEDYRSVYMYGRVGYLVTAQFIETLDHPAYFASFGHTAEATAAVAR